MPLQPAVQRTQSLLSPALKARLWEVKCKQVLEHSRAPFEMLYPLPCSTTRLASQSTPHQGLLVYLPRNGMGP